MSHNQNVKAPDLECALEGASFGVASEEVPPASTVRKRRTKEEPVSTHTENPKPKTLHQRLAFTETILAGPGYLQESAKFYFQHKARFKNEILSGLTVAIAQVSAANSRGA
jgi:hypothetical protein